MCVELATIIARNAQAVGYDKPIFNGYGAASNDLVEKELTLDLAFRTERLLQTYGFKTVLTRRDDTFVSLLDRAEFANKYERSLFVSLHFNKSEAPAATGIETYYASQKVLPFGDHKGTGLALMMATVHSAVRAYEVLARDRERLGAPLERDRDSVAADLEVVERLVAERAVAIVRCHRRGVHLLDRDRHRGHVRIQQAVARDPQGQVLTQPSARSSRLNSGSCR